MGSLVPCKECGESVARSARTCPHCGVAGPGKTASGIIALLLVFVAIGAWSFALSDSSSPASGLAAEYESLLEETAVPETVPAWTHLSSRDEMTGAQSFYAQSPEGSPTRPMQFPYGSTTATMIVACNATSEWAYIYFSETPNLVNEDIENGYNVITTRIRWNDRVETVTLTQEWGENALHFRNYGGAIANILAASTALVELDWYGQGSVYFQVSLNGSSSAIQAIRSSC